MKTAHKSMLCLIVILLMIRQFRSVTTVQGTPGDSSEQQASLRC